MKNAESSGFDSHTKSSTLQINSQVIARSGENVAEHSRMEEKHQAFGHQVVDRLQVQGS